MALMARIFAAPLMIDLTCVPATQKPSSPRMVCTTTMVVVTAATDGGLLSPLRECAMGGANAQNGTIHRRMRNTPTRRRNEDGPADFVSPVADDPLGNGFPTPLISTLGLLLSHSTMVEREVAVLTREGVSQDRQQGAQSGEPGLFVLGDDFVSGGRWHTCILECSTQVGVGVERNAAASLTCAFAETPSAIAGLSWMPVKKGRVERGDQYRTGDGDGGNCSLQIFPVRPRGHSCQS